MPVALKGRTDPYMQRKAHPQKSVKNRIATALLSVPWWVSGTRVVGVRLTERRPPVTRERQGAGRSGPKLTSRVSRCLHTPASLRDEIKHTVFMPLRQDIVNSISSEGAWGQSRPEALRGIRSVTNSAATFRPLPFPSLNTAPLTACCVDHGPLSGTGTTPEALLCPVQPDKLYHF